MLWRGVKVYVEVVQGQAVGKGLLCWGWVVDGMNGETSSWDCVCSRRAGGHRHWGPWMGFKDVLGSQWWRVGPKISLIISEGFQMVVPKLGWRGAPSALSPVWHPLLGVLGTGFNIAGPQHNLSSLSPWGDLLCLLPCSSPPKKCVICSPQSHRMDLLMLWPSASVIYALARRSVTGSTAWPRSLSWEQTECLGHAESNLKLTDASSSPVFLRLQCCVPLNPLKHGKGVWDAMGQLL